MRPIDKPTIAVRVILVFCVFGIFVYNYATAPKVGEPIFYNIEKNPKIVIYEDEKNEEDIKEDIVQIININTATIEELQQLTGIGEVTANSIMEYRLDVGYFVEIEDIMNVSGIGEAKFEKIKDFIIV